MVSDRPYAIMGLVVARDVQMEVWVAAKGSGGLDDVYAQVDEFGEFGEVLGGKAIEVGLEVLSGKGERSTEFGPVVKGSEEFSEGRTQGGQHN
jgi:hypothetical protein